MELVQERDKWRSVVKLQRMPDKWDCMRWKTAPLLNNKLLQNPLRLQTRRVLGRI